MLMRYEDDAFPPPYPEVLNGRVEKPPTDARVNGTEGVVQKDDIGISVEGSGQRDPRPLGMRVQKRKGGRMFRW